MILDRIVSENRRRLEIRRHECSLAEIEKLALKQAPALSFAAALSVAGINLIAEVKKASPSRGLIRADFDPVAIAQTYADSGASAISVLTEEKYFQGSLNHLKDIRNTLGDSLPLLRKDFLDDPYQIYESRAYGADCLLLIVAILNPDKLGALLRLSHQLDMSCLVEVHDETELDVALECHAKIIGINNRNLKDFTVDLSTTKRLRPRIPPDIIAVSESGIKNRGDMEKLTSWGVNGALVGEALVAATDIPAKMRQLIGQD